MSRGMDEGDRAYRNLIGGEWVEAAEGGTFDSRNPADTSDAVGRFAASTEADAVAAIEAAQRAFLSWRESPPTSRAEILYRAAGLLEENLDALAVELTREEGKVLASARQEVRRTAQTLRYYASEGLNIAGETLPSDDAATRVYTRKEPLGVVSVITPWNFPLSIPARKIAPALAAGNAVVFKPASETPLMGVRLAEALHRAGLPAGALNLVTGSASRVGEPLLRHPAVQAVTFTGSTAVGEHIHRAARLSTRVQLELGGKNPLLVLEDADLELAADLAVKGGLELTGQACTGTSRIIVVDAVHDAFAAKLLGKVRRLRVGNGLAEGTEIGPLANESQLRSVLSYVAIGKDEGAELLFGGGRLTGEPYDAGYFVQPAVFAQVRPEMRIAREEIFGPVLAILRAKDYREAFEMANASEYGLSASICTSDPERMEAFARYAEAGVVKINLPTTGNAYNAPFGGMKLSSTATYREAGREAMAFYTRSKTVYHGFRGIKDGGMAF